MSRRWMVLFLVWGCCVGCGLERGESDFEDQSFDAADGEENDIEEDGAPSGELGSGSGAGTMTGSWLQVHEASSCVLGQEQVSTAFYVVEIEEEGPVLRERRRLCELDLSPVLGFRPLATAGVLESIEFVEIDRGLVSRLVEGGAYSSATELGLWGIDLEDPLRDPVPADAESEEVIDADGDGHPGVSLPLEGSGCERYMGQRQVVRYSGFFVAPNEIRGGSVTRTEMMVYGASAAVCMLAPQVVANDEYSEFRMVRIDGLGGSVSADEDGDGTIDCEEAAVFFDEAWELREPNNQLCGR